MSDYSYETCLHNIAWLRAHHGISKRRMARILHIAVPTLDKIERGEKSMSLNGNMVHHISDEFHITPNVLFGKRLGE